MKTKSLIKALKKNNLKVEMYQYEISVWNYEKGTFEKGLSTPRYYCEGTKKICEWFDQEDRATCVNVRRIGDNHDSQRDYHAGCFCDTIKEVVASLTY